MYVNLNHRGTEDTEDTEDRKLSSSEGQHSLLDIFVFSVPLW
jgi:hypothetical protein